jgi:hypothetical protein
LVVQHKNETLSSGGTIICRLEMAGQNVHFADPVIGEKALGCLGIRPILAAERNRRVERNESDLGRVASEELREFVSRYSKR